MAGFTTQNTEHLIRSEIWSRQIKEVLLPELMGLKYVRMLSEFTDGDTLNIPSIGQAEVMDYVENQAIRYTAMDTGNFTFSIDQYKSSATYITEKMKQDTFYMNELVSRFVPSQSRAIMAAMETRLLNTGVEQQTASALNTINGANHRWVASGTNEVLTATDFNLARYALQLANVPMTNLVAIIDPSAEYSFNKQFVDAGVVYNPAYQGIVNTGISTGMRFIRNVFGFDVYVSQYLKKGIAETINGRSVTNGVANLFFSAAADVVPLVGAIRQPPKVDSEYNKDLQREEYVTTARYGFKLFRPENFVVVLSDTDQVA